MNTVHCSKYDTNGTRHRVRILIQKNFVELSGVSLLETIRIPRGSISWLSGGKSLSHVLCLYLCLYLYDYFVWLSGVMGLTQASRHKHTRPRPREDQGSGQFGLFSFEKEEKEVGGWEASWKIGYGEKNWQRIWSEFIDWDEVVKSNVKTNKSQLRRLELSSSRILKLKWTIPLIQLLTFIFSLSRIILSVKYKTIHGFSNWYYSITTRTTNAKNILHKIINVHQPLLDTICWEHLSC